LPDRSEKLEFYILETKALIKMQNKVTSINIEDIRFPTSLALDGSDAMNEAPYYSAAYVIIQTSSGMEGHGLTFTTGRGNELCTAGIKSLSAILIGRDVDGLFSDLGGIWKDLTGDSQLRWVGPEKGVIHLAAGALMNGLWDFYSKTLGKPLWRVLSEMDPKQTIDLIDWTYLRDALDPGAALERLQEQQPGSKRADDANPKNWLSCLYYFSGLAWLQR
jgi:L-fuconate dehydratase